MSLDPRRHYVAVAAHCDSVATYGDTSALQALVDSGDAFPARLLDPSHPSYHLHERSQDLYAADQLRYEHALEMWDGVGTPPAPPQHHELFLLTQDALDEATWWSAGERLFPHPAWTDNGEAAPPEEPQP